MADNGQQREYDGCIHVVVSGKKTIEKLVDSGYNIIEHEGVHRVCLPIHTKKD